MPGEPRIRVLIAAGRASTRSALGTLLDLEPSLEPAGAATDLPTAVRLLRSRRPDVLLIERALLGVPGLPWLPTLAQEAPGVAIFLVGMGDHPRLGVQALRAGATGYIRLDEASERLMPALASGPAA